MRPWRTMSLGSGKAHRRLWGRRLRALRSMICSATILALVFLSAGCSKQPPQTTVIVSGEHVFIGWSICSPRTLKRVVVKNDDLVPVLTLDLVDGASALSYVDVFQPGDSWRTSGALSFGKQFTEVGYDEKGINLGGKTIEVASKSDLKHRSPTTLDDWLATRAQKCG